jgi:hypothetical protein
LACRRKLALLNREGERYHDFNSLFFDQIPENKCFHADLLNKHAFLILNRLRMDKRFTAG